MSADRHAKSKAIFLEACSLTPERRTPFVAQACAGDDALRREVERMLQHHLPLRDQKSSTAAVGARDISEPAAFETGDLVAERYRIVALLGEGAMGRVYRAEDDRLQQTVALKFLPRLQVLDPTWRRRVESEVKLGREVGHPNICRVYDLGEIEGSPFISMEYVDGEDLASLLRRVGRLTGSRAVDIARQLCAGLAAAHIHGVLHRDLKPANVMIDQKGRVRITDFGLAVLAGNVARGEIRAGTPRYMAPEQLAGVAVTEKSDLYSLGLVLYEMFTGRPAFEADNVVEYLRLHQSVEPTPPSAIVPEIEPSVEAVILACLRKDPALRPESALHVAAALPGGDLLAAALDAGQIPTREMLALAAAQGSIDRRRQYQAAAAALILMVAGIFLGSDTHPIGGTKPPEVLAEKAREVWRLSGHDSNLGHFESRYLLSPELEIERGDIRPRMSLATREQLLFRCTAHPALGSSAGTELISFLMPGAKPVLFEGSSDAQSTIILDSQGRLLWLESRLGESGSEPAGTSEADWTGLVRATGHDPGSLIPVEPLKIPQALGDQRAAFLVPVDETQDRTIRLEVGRGPHRVQFLAVVEELPAGTVSPFSSNPMRWQLVGAARNTVLLLLMFAAVPAAWMSWKRGGDLVGAARLGVCVLMLHLFSQLFSMRAVGDFYGTLERLTGTVMTALCEGMVVALFYLALESQVRRLWPRTLGGWSRLLAGHFRDRFVGRDVLIGCLVGIFWALLAFLDRRVPEWMGWQSRPQLPLYQGMDDVLGARFAVAGVFNLLRTGIYHALAFLLLLVVATWVSGARRWAALAMTWIVGAAMFAPAASHPVTAWTLFAAGILGIALFVLTQCGLVSLLTAILVVGWLSALPITTNMDAWHAGYGVLAVAAPLGLGLWGLYQSLQSPALADIRHPSLSPS